ncbi:MAG: hypothetical protein QXE79_08210, partial [Candidatus Bathyarchaeia archaeon]
MDEAVRELKKILGVKYVNSVVGEYNLIAKLEVESESDIKRCVEQMKEIDSIKGTLALKVKPPIPRAYIDLESKIEDVVGETGIIKPKYGGYDIAVLD